MMPKENPFKLIGYHGPELFCDREKELNRLTEYAENGINTTLFSLRRMGKTGLIQHFFHQLQQTKSHNVVYVDVYDSSNLHQFTNRLATALLNTFPEKKSVGKKFMALLRGFSPVISYDPFTGIPQVELHFSSYQQNQQSLVGLFDFLEQQKKRTVVAIDEFQQIAHYPEKNTEATLRTIIQPLKKINFIFSGSHKHLLLQIFSNANRPFFSSTSPLHLDRIPEESYAAFIQYLFKESKRNIAPDAIKHILNWTKRHTYYTQALCNKVYQQDSRNIELKHVYSACNTILAEQEPVFFQYRNLLTKGQWNLLIAIAKENQVYEPTGARFTAKYHLGNPASVRRSLLALIDKEMVFKESSDEIYYEVYNCFLSRWLALKF
jgi:AAA+ ATPase superfamily predicted ATPase